MSLYGISLLEAFSKEAKNPALTYLSTDNEATNAFMGDQDENVKKNFQEMMSKAGYDSIREGVSTLLIGYMAGKKDPKTGEPLYSIDEIMDSNCLLEEKKEIFREINESLTKVNYDKENDEQLAKLDTALLYGVKRIADGFTAELDDIFRENRLDDLMNTKFFIQSRLIWELNENYFSTKNPKFENRVLKDETLTGWKNDTEQLSGVTSLLGYYIQNIENLYGKDSTDFEQLETYLSHFLLCKGELHHMCSMMQEEDASVTDYELESYNKLLVDNCFFNENEYAKQFKNRVEQIGDSPEIRQGYANLAAKNMLFNPIKEDINPERNSYKNGYPDYSFPTQAQLKKGALLGGLEKIESLESFWHTSTEWKCMKHALESATKLSDQNQDYASMVAYEESLRLVYEMTQKYIDHKQVGNNTGKDEQRLLAAQELKNMVAKELIVASKKLAAVGHEDPFAKETFEKRSQFLEALKEELARTRTKGDGSSDEFTKMVSDLNSMSANLHFCAFSNEATRENLSNHPEGLKQVISETLNTVQTYLTRKETNNNGSERSVERIRLAKVAQHYLKDMLHELPEAKAEKTVEKLPELPAEKSWMKYIYFQQRDSLEGNIKSFASCAEENEEYLKGLATELSGKSKEEAEKVLASDEVKAALCVQYIGCLYKQQIKKVMEEEKSVHEMAALFSHSLPELCNYVKNGEIHRLAEQVMQDEIFKEKVLNNLELNDLDQIANHGGMDLLAKYAMREGKTPELDSLYFPGKKVNGPSIGAIH